MTVVPSPTTCSHPCLRPDSSLDVPLDAIAASVDDPSLILPDDTGSALSISVEGALMQSKEMQQQPTRQVDISGQTINVDDIQPNSYEIVNITYQEGLKYSDEETQVASVSAEFEIMRDGAMETVYGEAEVVSRATSRKLEGGVVEFVGDVVRTVVVSGRWWWKRRKQARSSIAMTLAGAVVVVVMMMMRVATITLSSARASRKWAAKSSSLSETPWR